MEPWLRKGRQAHDPPITSSFPAAGFTRPGRRADARRRRPGRRRCAAASAASLPCDIYASGGTPCVAAHSTTRALYGLTTARCTRCGGVGQRHPQHRRAQRGRCRERRRAGLLLCQHDLRDHRDLRPVGPRQRPHAGAPGRGRPAAPTTSRTRPPRRHDGGQKAYGVYVAPGTGYRNDSPPDRPGDEPEGMYMIADGNHVNAGCCFDYGKAETNSIDTGAGSMDALYFGTATTWGYGPGPGPWGTVVDQENNIFSGMVGRALQRQRPDDPLPLRHGAVGQRRPESPMDDQRGRRAAGRADQPYYDGVRPERLLAAAKREGGHRARQRRRQLQRLARHVLRGRHDDGLPVG